MTGNPTAALRILGVITSLALLVACGPKRTALSDRTTPACALGLELMNETDYSLDVFFASLAKGSPSFRVGRAAKGRTVFRLSDAIISRMNSGPFRSSFFVRRSEEFRNRDEGGMPPLDYTKVRYQTICM